MRNDSGQVEKDCKKVKDVKSYLREESGRCRVTGCNVNLASESTRNCRVKTCQKHQAALVVDVGGRPCRFCQQCMRLQSLERFDGDRRSCRSRLVRQNLRRKRKGAAKLAAKKASSDAQERQDLTALNNTCSPKGTTRHPQWLLPASDYSVSSAQADCESQLEPNTIYRRWRASDQSACSEPVGNTMSRRNQALRASDHSTSETHPRVSEGLVRSDNPHSEGGRIHCIGNGNSKPPDDDCPKVDALFNRELQAFEACIPVLHPHLCEGEGCTVCEKTHAMPYGRPLDHEALDVTTSIGCPDDLQMCGMPKWEGMFMGSFVVKLSMDAFGMTPDKLPDHLFNQLLAVLNDREQADA